MMQFLTFSIIMPSKVMPDTEPMPPCHVLILTPLSEFLITAFLTVIFDTHACELCTPKLPMLHTQYDTIRQTIRYNIIQHMNSNYFVCICIIPDAVAGSTGHILNVHIRTSGTDGNAIITFGIEKQTKVKILRS